MDINKFIWIFINFDFYITHCSETILQSISLSSHQLAGVYTKSVHSYICRPFLLGAGDPGFDLPARARFLKFRRFSFLLGVLDVFEIPRDVVLSDVSIFKQSLLLATNLQSLFSSGATWFELNAEV